MARTREQHEAEIRTQTPEIVVTDGERRSVFRPGDPEYEADIAAWVEQHLAAEVEIEAEAGRAELRRQVPLARTRLQEIADVAGAPTAAQRDAAIRDIARILDRLIGAVVAAAGDEP